MISLDDLGQVVEELRAHGIDAVHDFLYGPGGFVEGLDIGDDFFPLWELRMAENEAALAQADFAAIVRRRGPDWTVDEPRKVSEGAAGSC